MRPSQNISIVMEQPPMPHEIKAGLPPDCSNVLLRALSKRKEDRYPTCMGFVDALTPALIPMTTPRAGTEPEIPRPRVRTLPEISASLPLLPRRHWMIPLAIALVINVR